MGVFDRIILFLSTATLVFLSGTLLTVAAGWSVPINYLRANLYAPGGRLGLGLTGAVFLLVSLRVLYLALHRSGPNAVLVQEGKLGEVSVSLGAIANLVRKVAANTRGVREVKADVRLTAEGVRASLRVVVSPEVCIPDLATELQTTVEERIRDVVGIGVEKVRIIVENIATEGKRRRVD